jgi:hypothetical protein
MDASKIMVLGLTWALMIPWLSLVAITAVSAFKKWQRTKDFLRRQMFYLWLGATIVFIGDSLHTIADTISAYTNSPTGPLQILGTIFEFRTFAMAFDVMVFISYYTLWALFIVTRYQQNQLESHDKISIGLAMAAMVLTLPGVIPNALGIYTLEYNITLWTPHIICFIIFGVMTVWKLIRCSRHALKQAADPLVQNQERALSITGIGFACSFLFFILSLALIPLNEKFGMFMIPKTFAYMLAFIYLIKSIKLSTPNA